MAIFYQYIKGYSPAGPTGPTGSGSFAFLSFGPSGVSLKTTEANSFSATGTEHGDLLTTAGVPQTVTKRVNFNGQVDFANRVNIGPSGTLSVAAERPILFGPSGAQIKSGPSGVSLDIIGGPTGISMQGPIKATGGMALSGDLSVTGSIRATSLVEGTYFNATSDARLKENIEPLTSSALDYLNRIKVCSFNYLSIPEEKCIGVIAQDLEKLGLYNDIDFVAENGSALTVKESKFVYLLMKAIQEQQEEIKELKAQLEELRHE